MRSEQEILKEIEFHRDKIKTLEAEFWSVKNAKAKRSRNSYRDRKKMLDSTAQLFEKLLTPGDVVKVTGSRATPIRQVKEIVPSKWGCGTLVGAACYVNPYSGAITRVDEFNIIRCGTNKITAVAREGRWLTARELYETNY